MSYPQRSTPILGQLCTLLVKDQFGDLASRVFSVLARHGRQSLGGLVRNSYLTSRQIKHGIVVLLQQHLIFHSAASPAADPRATFYSVDWGQSYALVRSGKIIQAVENRFGKKAANLMANLLSLGHTRIGDLEEAYFPTDDGESDVDSDDEIVRNSVKSNGVRVNGAHTTTNGSTGPIQNGSTKGQTLTNGNGQLGQGDSTFGNGDNTSLIEQSNVNGNNKKRHRESDGDAVIAQQPYQLEDESSITSVEELYTIIHHLMYHGWIMVVEDNQFLSRGDLHDMVKTEIVEAEFGGNTPTGTKEQSRLALMILQRKRQVRDAWVSMDRMASRKRTAADSASSRAKRVKMSGGVRWMAPGAETIDLDESLVIRMNPDKASVAIRTDQLVRLVDRRLGFVPAKIYETMLLTLEVHIKRCYEEWPDPPVKNPDLGIEQEVDPRFLVTARDVAKKIDPRLDVFDGLDPRHVSHITGHSLDQDGHMINPLDPVDLSVDLRTKIIHTHIKILSDDPFHFVTWHSRAGYSQWRIEFEDIAKTMIQHEIENTVSARTRDGLGLMLIRALKKKGKLDERQTCNAMMMSAAEIRTIVNDLMVQGFVQIQEIPKVERREAKHSTHLIWYDRQRTRERLLHDTYKGMVRILQRTAFEKEKVQELLRKAERSDVVGNEEKWLSREELDALKKWNGIEEKLLVQLNRIDDLVATLNDYTGPLTSV